MPSELMKTWSRESNPGFPGRIVNHFTVPETLRASNRGATSCQKLSAFEGGKKFLDAGRQSEPSVPLFVFLFTVNALCGKAALRVELK